MVSLSFVQFSAFVHWKNNIFNIFCISGWAGLAKSSWLGKVRPLQWPQNAENVKTLFFQRKNAEKCCFHMVSLGFVQFSAFFHWRSNIFSIFCISGWAGLAKSGWLGIPKYRKCSTCCFFDAKMQKCEWCQQTWVWQLWELNVMWEGGHNSFLLNNFQLLFQHAGDVTECRGNLTPVRPYIYIYIYIYYIYIYIEMHA